MTGVRGTVLLVDDEAYVRHSLATVLERHGFNVRTAEGLERALGDHDLEGIDALVSDLKMPGGDGLQLIERVRALDASTPIIVYTGHGSVASAVDCMRAGAVDYLQKPVDPDQMVLVLERAIEVSGERRQLHYLRERRQGGGDGDPLGVSPQWIESVDQARRVATTDAAVLLLGETGSGKGELAALIHRASPRARAACVEVACGAVPLELFEAEFFGHRKGAFTGAVEDREGRFRVAHRGTLFLDDVEALSPAAQAKVLRVLETGRFERVGDSRPTTVDVRLISASNSDLEAEVEAGRFREDLWFRINVMTIHVPPLRERPEDIPVLAEAFLERYARRLDRPVRGIDASGMERLLAYDWPGNVRELRNVIERAVLLTDGEVVDADLLPRESSRSGADSRDGTRGTEEIGARDLRSRLLLEEKRILIEALHRSGGVRRHAARELGIDERNMSYYLKKHGLQNR